LGAVLLVALSAGFAGFALWHAYVAVFARSADNDGAQRLGNAGRAVLYAVLCALAIQFVTSPSQHKNSDRTDQTWTAKVLHWPGGRALVFAVGIVVIGAAVFLAWRALSARSQDEPAVLEAAPRETPPVKALGMIGNVARAAVLVLIGAFLLDAALRRQPRETVGLDGALRRLLGHGVGPLLVLLVALGFACFGVYSLARAWTNRGHVGRPA
jgi:hypothetical protein